MRRRVGLTDFKETPAAIFETRATGAWDKCDRYVIHKGEIRAAPDRVRGLKRGLTDADDEGWVVYDPIHDVPDLFLRFARLYGESDFNRAALDFAEKYGLPSGADEAPAPAGKVGFQTEAMNWSLSQFHHEVRRAWAVLALYEAVLNDEDGTVRKLLSEYSDIETFGLWLSLLQDPAEDQNYALMVGLRCAQDATEEIVHKYCRPEIIASLAAPETRPSVSHETNIFWTFDNLLGAMYLQMYWLMASSESIARCEHCSRIISLGRPHPGGRKRRSDKKFCDDACRQAHHRSKNRA